MPRSILCAVQVTGGDERVGDILYTRTTASFRGVAILVASPRTVIIHFESIRNLGSSVQAPICLRPRLPSRSKLTTLARRVLVRTMMAPHRAARRRLACLSFLSSVASSFPPRRRVSYRFPLCPSTPLFLSRRVVEPTQSRTTIRAQSTVHFPQVPPLRLRMQLSDCKPTLSLRHH